MAVAVGVGLLAGSESVVGCNVVAFVAVELAGAAVFVAVNEVVRAAVVTAVVAEVAVGGNDVFGGAAVSAGNGDVMVRGTTVSVSTTTSAIVDVAVARLFDNADAAHPPPTVTAISSPIVAIPAHTILGTPFRFVSIGAVFTSGATVAALSP